jgi:putative addiction module killer protein
MIEVRQTIEFSDWLHRLNDANAAARIVARIRRMELGNPGDARSVGGGVMEMRIAYVRVTASITCIVGRKS